MGDMGEGFGGGCEVNWNRGGKKEWEGEEGGVKLWRSFGGRKTSCRS